MKVYLASPFFTKEQRAVKARIKEHLEAMCALNESYEICDPQTASDFSSWEYNNADWGNQTFCGDWEKLEECDMVIAIDWGLYGDCGTSWEIGFAFARNKEVYVVAPMTTLSKPHSLMVVNGCANFMTEARFLTINDFWDLPLEKYFALGVEQK